MTSVFDMANAVRDLGLLEQKRLFELDELTIRNHGAMVDGGLSGLRILVARVSDADRLLRAIAPHETAFRLWLDARQVAGPLDRASEVPAATISSI